MKSFLLLVIVIVAKWGAAQDNFYTDLGAALTAEVNFIFPTNFEASCVSEGCPELQSSHLCPSATNTQDDQQILQTVASCFKKPMCGTTMDPKDILPITFSTQQILAAISSFFTGQCLFLSNVTQLFNMSKQLITVTDSADNSINIATTIPNVYVPGAVDCNFALLGFPISLPRVSMVFDFNFTSNILASIADLDTEFQVLNSKVVFNQAEFYLPTLLPGFNFGQLFSANFETFAENAGVDQALAKTLANAYQAGLQVTEDNCS